MQRLSEEKVFKDPVHKYIYVQHQLIWDLINTKEFQRLRRIRQLGTSFLTFHGAEHSRFSHSLGVYEITRKILSQFERNQFLSWDADKSLLALCAALLHDIGHAPFSHSMEPVWSVDHEEWTCRMILGDTDIHQLLSQVSSDFPQAVAQVICKTYPDQRVTGLISSQLDADRMDYLLRDAYFTGVNYGTFDLERILRLLRPHRGHIVVKESGMHAVEDYLMARYQMHWQVYFHPVTRSSEILLGKIFQRAKALYEDGYTFQFIWEPLPAFLNGHVQLHEYLAVDESFMQMTFMQWCHEKDEILSDLCQRFMHRRLFKYIAKETLPAEWLQDVEERMSAAGISVPYYMAVDSPSDLSYDVYQPGDRKEKSPIQLLTESVTGSAQLVEISKVSKIVKSISGNQQGLYYVYYPEEHITL